MIEEEDTQLSMSTTTPQRNPKLQGSETSNQVGSSRRDGSMIIAFEANSPLLARANEPDSAAAKDGESLKRTKNKNTNLSAANNNLIENREGE